MLPLFFRRALVLILAAGSLSLAAASPARAKSGDASGGGTTVDVNFFYDTLKDDGSWYNTTEYGDVWQPYIAYKSDSWRPYTDGYWSYTDGGWMFVSNENFGWAVYHYGRWTRLKDIGWAWVPGTDWAPAWVTWRASKADGNGPPDSANGPAPAVADDKAAPPPDAGPGGPANSPPVSENYIGWAPLPPEPAAYTAVDYSYGPTVDVDFGIDPYDYCFTDVRSFGAPWVAAVIFDPERSYYYADRSVNITNIYYNRSNRYNGFYAGGPDYDRLRGLSQRPIPQYQLRQTNGAAAQRAIRTGQFNQLNGNTLGVAAPQFSRKSVGPDGRVKLTRASALAKAEVNRGAPAAADSPAYKQARESFTKQGETYRSAHPNATVSRAAALEAAGKGGAAPETAPKIQTTPRARNEERAARQTAGGDAPPAETTRAEALKERAAGGHGQPAATATGAAHRTRHEATRSTETHPAAGEPRTATVTRAHALEAARSPHAPSTPHAEPHSVPKVSAPPVQKGGGGSGGGGNQTNGKKKNPPGH